MLPNRSKSSQQKIEEQLAEILKNPDSLTPQEESELKAMIAAAGISGATLKAAQAIKNPESLGEQMHEKTLKMIEEAYAQGLKNPRRATIDPQKLVDACERLGKILERENEKRDEQLRKLEETRATLIAGHDKLVAAIEKTQDDWRKQGCPVTRPVTVGKPLKLKKPAP